MLSVRFHPYHVYIFATSTRKGIGAPIKVGISNNVRNRLQTVQTNYPFDLIIYRVWKGPEFQIAKIIESAFHESNPEFGLRGEWSSLEPKTAAEKIDQFIRNGRVRIDLLTHHHVQRHIESREKNLRLFEQWSLTAPIGELT